MRVLRYKVNGEKGTEIDIRNNEVDLREEIGGELAAFALNEEVSIDVIYRSNSENDDLEPNCVVTKPDGEDVTIYGDFVVAGVNGRVFKRLEKEDDAFVLEKIRPIA